MQMMVMCTGTVTAPAEKNNTMMDPNLELL